MTTDHSAKTRLKAREERNAKVDNHLVAELRENFGKGYARRLRMAGRIPAVVFGHGTAPQHVSLPAHEVGLLLRKANAILELDIAGKKTLALVKDVQKDPLSTLTLSSSRRVRRFTLKFRSTLRASPSAARSPCSK